MEIQWYIYKDYQIEGPFSWDELKQEVDSGRINPEDLIWNHTMRSWLEADQVLDLVNYPSTTATTLPPQPSKLKAFIYNLNYKQVAIIAVITFLLSLGATSIFLFINQDDRTTNDDFEDMLDYYIQFEESEEEARKFNEEVSGEIANSKQESSQDKTGSMEQVIQEGVTDQDKQVDITTNREEENQESNAVPAAQETDGLFNSADVNEETLSWLGGTYTGPLLEDIPHGQGVWRHPDGRSYTGDFTHGEITGYGTMTFSGGERYVGSFLKAKAHGNGSLIHPRGKKYMGEFRHGIIEGYGTMIFPEGERYVGYFKNGVAHGRGTMTHPDGRSVSGTWTNGKLTEKD